MFDHANASPPIHDWRRCQWRANDRVNCTDEIAVNPKDRFPELNLDPKCVEAFVSPSGRVSSDQASCLHRLEGILIFRLGSKVDLVGRRLKLREWIAGMLPPRVERDVEERPEPERRRCARATLSQEHVAETVLLRASTEGREGCV